MAVQGVPMMAGPEDSVSSTNFQWTECVKANYAGPGSEDVS